MIRRAKEYEHELLTDISFKSKGYWEYPEHYFDIWADELTVGPEYIRKNAVFVLEHDGVAVGYYSVIHLEDDVEISSISIPRGFWLDHMFMLPGYIGKGFGKALFSHLRHFLIDCNIEVLNILADPNAVTFYKKMGCVYVKEYPSTIRNRTTPLLRFAAADRGPHLSGGPQRSG